MSRTLLCEVSAVLVKDIDPAAFGSDIHTSRARIIRQHIGRFTDTIVVNHSSVSQVDGDDRGVGFATDEHHLPGDVERLAVWMVAPGCRNAFCYSETDRIEDGKVVTALNGNHHPVGGR